MVSDREVAVIGREISHYRILEPVAEGGMGCVWKAEDVTLGRFVAVKEIRNLAQDPEADLRFLREAQAVSRIDHPNVVTFYEMVDAPDQQYLVMQYVEGRSLRSRLNDGALAPPEALDIACQVASALEAAHCVEVVHRDLKPENVMIGPSGVAKVLDFGVAHFNDRSTITRSGSMVGTVPYMAPEQVQSRSIDRRTDVYALGVLLYEMLTGRLPYEGRDVGSVVYEIVNTTPRTVTQVRPSVPIELSRIVTQAMSKKPEDRYSSAAEMLHDLQLARAGLLKAGNQPYHYKRRLRRRALWTMAAIASGLAVIVAARPMVAGWIQPGPPRIVVAPWENSAGRSPEAWMSSGIMDGLIRAIGGYGGIRVVSRETFAATCETIQPKGGLGNSAGTELAARKLGARFLVHGAFEQQGNRIRVHCDLVDVRRGTLVRSWTRDLSEPDFDFQGCLDHFADKIALELSPGRHDASRSPAGRRIPLESLRHFTAALEASDAGDRQGALSQARLAVKAEPKYAEAHLFIVQNSLDPLEQRRHMALAVATANDAPKSVREAIQAVQLTQADRFPEAIALYEKILENNPEAVSVGEDLVHLYLRTRRFSDMAALCAMLHRVNPYDYSFYGIWSQAYLMIGRNDRAVAVLEEWRASLPGSSEPLRDLAALHELLGNYSVALAVCDTLERLQPGASTNVRAFVLADVGRLREAEGLFRRELSDQDPHYGPARAQTYLAMLSYMRRDYRGGVAFADSAVRRSPEMFNYWVAGLLAAALRDSVVTWKYFRLLEPTQSRTGPEADGPRRFAHHLLGTFALAKGDGAGAVREFETCLKYTARSDGTYFKTDLGRALLVAGDAKRASEVLEDALAFNPNYPPALLYFSQASFRLGKKLDGRRALDRLGDLLKEADEDFPLKRELRRLRAASDAHRPLAVRASESSDTHRAQGSNL